MKANPLTNYIVEYSKFKDDVFVNITKVNVPASLLRGSMQTAVVPSYLGAR